ncbi:MAG: hypothetical protein ACOC5U_03470 [Candidatus Aminicenantaceae bacterium]
MSLVNCGHGGGVMDKPARMKAERARFLSAGEGSEAGIGADVLAGDIRVAAIHLPLPWPRGFDFLSNEPG